MTRCSQPRRRTTQQLQRSQWWTRWNCWRWIAISILLGMLIWRVCWPKADVVLAQQLVGNWQCHRELETGETLTLTYQFNSQGRFQYRVTAIRSEESASHLPETIWASGGLWVVHRSVLRLRLDQRPQGVLRAMQSFFLDVKSGNVFRDPHGAQARLELLDDQTVRVSWLQPGTENVTYTELWQRNSDVASLDD